MYKREYLNKAISIFMSAFVGAAMATAPAFAAGLRQENTVELLPNSASDDVKGSFLGNANDGEVSGVRAVMQQLNKLNVMAWLMTDNFTASRAQANEGEALVIDATGNATVNSFAGLEEALANEGVRSIRLNHNITIRNTLTINRSIRIFAEEKASLILVPGLNDRHFLLEGTGLAVELENIVFLGASMGAGGGIAAGSDANNSSLRIDGCDFIGNIRPGTDEDKGKGGAISIDNAQSLNSREFEVVVRGCKFESNKAGLKDGAVGSGGAIYINTAGCSLVVEDCIFTHNQSGKRGGAIAYYAQGSQDVSIRDSVFENNRSTEGGAICLVSAAESADAPLNATLSGNMLSKNTANNGGPDLQQRMGSGGGIYVATAAQSSRVNLTMEGGSIHDNQSFNYGGGLCLNADAGGHINASLGGGLLLEGNSVDIMDGKGGGVAAIGLGDESLALSLHDTNISGNDAQYGGGVFIKGTQEHSGQNISLTLGDGCAIQANKANYGGGVILFENASLAAAGNWTINDNNARFGGGGLYVKDSSTAVLSQGSISGNMAESGEGANRSGGGIYVCEDASAQLNGCTLESNSSENGGGIYAYGRVVANGCVFSRNSAVYGGGAYLNKQGSLELNECALEANNAYVRFESEGMSGGQGGAIYTADPSYANLSVKASRFVDNNAESGGYILEAAEFMEAGNISESAYTTPFYNAYNNFDINNTQGQMATLYAIEVQYHLGEKDEQPVVERIDRVFEGSEVLATLVAGLGENWQAMHRPEGYDEGYARFNFAANPVLTQDVSIKVVYNSTAAAVEEGGVAPAEHSGPADGGNSPDAGGPGGGDPSNGAESPGNQNPAGELEPADPNNPANNTHPANLPEQKNATTTPRKGPMAGRVSLGDNGQDLPPSDELAMVAPELLPTGQLRYSWGILNAVMVLASILIALGMLLRMVPGRMRVHCLPQKALGVLLAVASSLVFAFTQNTSLPAAATDRWSPVLLVLLLAQLLLAAGTYYKSIKLGLKRKRRRKRDEITESLLRDAM